MESRAGPAGPEGRVGQAGPEGAIGGLGPRGLEGPMGPARYSRLRAIRDWSGVIAIALIFALFGYAIYLGNRSDQEEIDLLNAVRELTVQNQELASRNQELADLVVREMAHHRCQAEEGFDQILEAIYQRPMPDLVEELCR